MIDAINKYKDTLLNTVDIPACIPVELVDRFENPWELMTLKVNLSQYDFNGKYDINKTSKELIEELKESKQSKDQLRITLLYIAKTNPLLRNKIKDLF